MKIGLIGTFDVENFGDCMFPELYAKLLRDRFGEVEVALYSPLPHAADILSFTDVNALPVDETPAALAVLDSDALILIGGETIGYGHSPGTFNFPRHTLSAYLRLWLAPILAARNPNLRPRFFAAQSVGATKMPADINRTLASCLAAADRVRFRDPYSAEWIRTDDITFGVDTDPMFLIDQVCTPEDWEHRATAQLPDGVVAHGYLAAQVSLGYGGNDLSAWVTSVAEIARARDLAVVLVPICHFMQDERLLSRLADMLRAKGVATHLMGGRRNVKDTAALVALSAGYIGSSLHGAVTAIAFARPLAVLGHTADGKHAGTLRAVSITDVVATRSADLPGCFSHSETLDLVAARETAQRLARASVDGLFDAIQNTPSNMPAKGLRTASKQLIAAERRIAPKAEAKRLILRAIRKTPGLAGLHRWWGLQKAFRGV